MKPLTTSGRGVLAIGETSRVSKVLALLSGAAGASPTPRGQVFTTGFVTIRGIPRCTSRRSIVSGLFASVAAIALSGSARVTASCGSGLARTRSMTGSSIEVNRISVRPTVA